MAQDTAQQAPAAPAHALLPLILPALAVGVGVGLFLVGVSVAAERLQHVLWRNLPDALGVGRYSVLWMLVVLTATGPAVGLVMWLVPRARRSGPCDHGAERSRAAGTGPRDRADAVGVPPREVVRA